jgi:hypothetical protein
MTKTAVFPRVLGALTLAYGAYTLARPQSLVRAAGLERTPDTVTRTGLTLGRVIGARDVLSGLAMTLASPGAPLRSAVLVRVACDASDVVGFGASVTSRDRAKVLIAATGWGLLCAASLPAAGVRR